MRDGISGNIHVKLKMMYWHRGDPSSHGSNWNIKKWLQSIYLCNEYVIYANVMEYKSKEIDCYTICEKKQNVRKEFNG